MSISLFVLFALATPFNWTFKAVSESDFPWPITIQDRERTIIKKGDEKAPVKIKGVRAKGRVVTTNNPYTDGEDWLKDLTIELSNPSDKTVTFLQVQIFFPHPERALKQPGAVLFIEHGDNPFNYATAAAMPVSTAKPMLPGDFLELKLSEAKYDAIGSLLETAGIPNNDKVEIRVSAIGFSDGTAWSGQMAQRNPNGGWLPLRPR